MATSINDWTEILICLVDCGACVVGLLWLVDIKRQAFCRVLDRLDIIRMKKIAYIARDQKEAVLAVGNLVENCRGAMTAKRIVGGKGGAIKPAVYLSSLSDLPHATSSATATPRASSLLML